VSPKPVPKRNRFFSPDDDGFDLLDSSQFHGRPPRFSLDLMTIEGLDVSCSECGRPIGEDGRWYSDGVGELYPHRAGCAAREFGG
jgi:hypothetical protein